MPHELLQSSNPHLLICFVRAEGMPERMDADPFADAGLFQIPPDLVVEYQGIDIVEVILSLIWQRSIVQTSGRNRKSRCEPLSPSEAHQSTTKSDGMSNFSEAAVGQ